VLCFLQAKQWHVASVLVFGFWFCFVFSKKTSEIDASRSHSKLSLSDQLLCVPGTGGRGAEQPVGDGLTCHVWFIVIHLIKEGTMNFYLLRL